MKRFALGLACCLATMALFVVNVSHSSSAKAADATVEVSATENTVNATADVYTPVATEDIEAKVLFDDFNYKTADDDNFIKNGWIVRTVKSWPGIPDASWGKGTITFVDDAETSANRLMQLNAATDGTSKNTTQAQVCQQRKFFEGTYAARVKFNDKPDKGPDGDNVVETFYQIAPYVKPLAPDYSEIDFEYLPNGGWGNAKNFFAWTTWYTVQIEPWNADNQSDNKIGSYDGWHTLVLQVADGKVTYYVDGDQVAQHSGKYYPRQRMSMNFNLWFIAGGSIHSSEMRNYSEQVDWAYYAQNTVLSPKEVDAEVDALRKDKTSFTDTIPANDPPLDSPCNL